MDLKKYVVSLVSVIIYMPVYGYDWNTNIGRGSVDNPYLIDTVEQLFSIGSDNALLNKSFKLNQDISLSGLFCNTAIIAPDIDSISAGFQGGYFTGTFDGNNHTISDMSIISDLTSQAYLGLFGSVSDSAAVCNLRMTHVFIQAPQATCIGALAGQATRATIYNCHAEGEILAKNNLAGLVYLLSSSTIQGCSFTGSVTATNSRDYIGGLIGYSDASTVKRCYTAGQITVGETTQSFGGLSGYVIGSLLSNCVSRMDLVCGKGCFNFGGLIGVFSFTFLDNSYSTGQISAAASANTFGGLIGACETSLFSVENCFSTCRLTGGDGTNVGGLVGFGTTEPVHCYFLSSADGGGPDNGIGQMLTESQMRQRASFVNYDFLGDSSDGASEIWRMCGNNMDYPKLSWQSAPDGDFNCPEGVDVLDLSLFAAVLLQRENDDTSFLQACDANYDGVINMADYAVLSANFLRQQP